MPADLTPRELEVLRLLSEGLTNIEIGYRLGVSPLTIKAHLATACYKTGVRNRTGLVGWAFRQGVLP